MKDKILDVAIVGAGLAGLSCAVTLTRAGRQCRLFESADQPGGRVRTDRVEGFLLDRGFQVLLDAYPECRRFLDYDRLRLGRFLPGALVWDGKTLLRLVDPLKHPTQLPNALRTPPGSLADKLRVGALKARLSLDSVARIQARAEMPTRQAFENLGFSQSMRKGFLEPFFSGIFLEESFSTSSRMFEFVFKMFSRGSAALPHNGMQALPDQLAANLPPGALRLRAPVRSVHDGGLLLESGEDIKARHVVLATDMDAAASLFSGIRSRPWNSTRCLYFSTPRSPLREPLIVLNGSGTGSFSNLSVPSDVASGYAPADAALISVSLRPGVSPDHEAVIAEIRACLGQPGMPLRFLRDYVIDRALPRQDPGDNPFGKAPRRLPDGTWICGDYRDSASIDGAMRSGRHAAEALLQA
ncbi:MAG: NAD(P)/FAD-dependent oxidoreductase [Oceanipulchritudo sp.]